MLVEDIRQQGAAKALGAIVSVMSDPNQDEGAVLRLCPHCRICLDSNRSKQADVPIMAS